MDLPDTGSSFWSQDASEVLRQAGSKRHGLSSAEAKARLPAAGPRRGEKDHAGPLLLFLRQFTSPIVLLLLGAAILSAVLGDPLDAGIIFFIVLVSGALGFWQEYAAGDAVSKLLSLVRLNATVLRDGKETDVPVETVVPGDVTVLNAGDVIPGDCLLLEASDLFVDESVLTGETFPVEKQPGRVAADGALAARTNTLFMGTHVISGSAAALVVHTGAETEFGKVSARLRLRPPETEFERGIRQFGYLLLQTTLLLVLVIFAGNALLRPEQIMESFLFSLALAVGLTPQLQPANVSVNLAHGAREMGKRKVIVKRLSSIENVGSMDVLCSDKTGTLTEGIPHLKGAQDLKGNVSDHVFLHAYLNAAFQTGFTNPVDDAIRAAGQPDISAYTRIDEVPYDFIRKRLTILVGTGGANRMITKGALSNVLEVCKTAEAAEAATIPIEQAQDDIQRQFGELCGQGFRVLGLAYRDVGEVRDIEKRDECEMVFLGLLVFFDPPRPGVEATIARLRELGVSMKIITGDNHVVARSLGAQLGVADPVMLTGPELHDMSAEALLHRAERTDVFAEVEPNQKERIIVSLRKAGHVVGYMGDGINDAPALHAADVGISVAGAVDVAQEAAAVVLLEKSLDVLVEGILEGRTTFANTLKYIFMATSANFGNMFSMAGASLLLPFLPLLPKQILLTNLLTDVPEMAISTDCVDDDWIRRPHRWDIGFIRRFMLVFGPVSSLFDYLTFGVLLFWLHANPDHFRTGWFQESVVSAVLIVLVVRTRGPAWKSRPGKYLAWATLGAALFTLVLPWTPAAPLLGFQPLPPAFIPALSLIVALYVLAAEATKRVFYRWAKF